jgi:phospholipase D1/2
VTGEHLKPLTGSSDPWPAGVEPDFTDIGVGIARTQPVMNGMESTKEVENLFLDSIDTAERTIYIENQFFTSQSIAARLAARLRQSPQLELLLVGPQTYDSWIEARTMRNGRIRFMRTFTEAGVADRVRLLYPHIEEGETTIDTMLHSKVMTIDETFLRVGSANVNNRSLGTDTECDLALEPTDDAGKARIAHVRSRLLADHCGVSPAEVARLLDSGTSLLHAAQSLSGRGRSLRPIDDGEPDPAEFSRYLETIADPERPIAPGALALLEFTGQQFRLPVANVLKVASVALLLLGLAAIWQFTSIGNRLDPAAMELIMASAAQSPWAPLYVVAVFLAGGLVAFPVTLLIAGTAAAFGPIAGFAYAGAGALASAVVTYGIGAWLGQRPLQSILGPKLTRIRNMICRTGILAIAAIRVVPLAPFTLVNMIAGACRIPIGDYVVGTALGLLPGLLALSALGHQIFRVIIDPSRGEVVLLVGAFLLWLALVIGREMLAKRGRRYSP